MKRLTKSVLLWFITLVMMLASAYYQRTTGPSYPLRGQVTVGGDTVAYRLPRTYGGPGDAVVALTVEDSHITGRLAFRRYKSADTWQEISMTRRAGELTAALPHQPPAGKIMYRVTLSAPGSEPVPLTDEPVIIRFKGAVPPAVLFPHVVLMFMAMLFSTRTGLEALTRGCSVPGLALWTTILLFLGGLILGPIVQKYAFGSFWTGWPFGHDLTDNKTLVAFVAWIIALARVRRNPESRTAVVVAAVVLLAIYLIPHSLLGSELDYSTVPE